MWTNMLSCTVVSTSWILMFFLFFDSTSEYEDLNHKTQACECKHVLILKLCLVLLQSGSAEMWGIPLSHGTKEKATWTNMSRAVPSHLNWWLKTVIVVFALKWGSLSVPNIVTAVSPSLNDCCNTHRTLFNQKTSHIFGCYKLGKKSVIIRW